MVTKTQNQPLNFTEINSYLAVKPDTESVELHRMIHTIPRTILGLASNFKITALPAISLSCVLDIHSNVYTYDPSEKNLQKMNRLFDVAMAVLIITSAVFFQPAVGILIDTRGIKKHTVTLIKELRKSDRDNIKLLELSTRIAIRVASIISVSIPAIYMGVQLMKLAENGYDLYAELNKETPVNKVDATKAVDITSAGLPAIMRINRLAHKIHAF